MWEQAQNKCRELSNEGNNIKKSMGEIDIEICMKNINKNWV